MSAVIPTTVSPRPYQKVQARRRIVAPFVTRRQRQQSILHGNMVGKKMANRATKYYVARCLNNIVQTFCNRHKNPEPVIGPGLSHNRRIGQWILSDQHCHQSAGLVVSGPGRRHSGRQYRRLIVDVDIGVQDGRLPACTSAPGRQCRRHVGVVDMAIGRQTEARHVSDGTRQGIDESRLPCAEFRNLLDGDLEVRRHAFPAGSWLMESGVWPCRRADRHRPRESGQLLARLGPEGDAPPP